MAVQKLTEEGDFDRSIALLNKIDDPWAVIVTRDAYDRLGEHLADLITSEPRRGAVFLRDLMRQAGINSKDQVMMSISSFAPVLKASGETVLLDTRHSREEIQAWFDNPLGNTILPNVP